MSHNRIGAVIVGGHGVIMRAEYAIGSGFGLKIDIFGSNLVFST